MIRYKSPKQLSLELFKSPFERGLDAKNRWVKLSRSLPWDEMASIYYHKMSSDQGAPGKDARIMIGAVIIKHKLKLSDREVIQQVLENPYLQYFLGLERFTNKPVFDPSLFPTIRKRLGVAQFEALNEEILIKAGLVERKEDEPEPPKNDGGGTDSDDDQEAEKKEAELREKPRKGKLLIDAMVSEQMIKHPTDLDLLNDSREEAERLIDLLYVPIPGKLKPRTYRKAAKNKYLAVAKQSRKSKRTVRKAIRKQLGYLKRDLGILDEILDQYPDRFERFTQRDLKIYWVIQHIYQQQKSMYENRIHTHSDRIVSIYQPWVRPIVTGKAFPKVQFGSKSSVSLVDGFASVHKIDWDNYNEGGDLQGQVKDFVERHGHYPESVVTDQKYGTRENRKWLKERGIRYSGKALGRPKKNPAPEEIQLKKLKKQENNMRSQIEGKFGQGKNGYGLRKIRARLSDTSESWIAAIFFVMNLEWFLRSTFFNYLIHIGTRGNLWSAFLKLKAQIREIFGYFEVTAHIEPKFGGVRG
ncbi:MAG: IS5 family transposase [Bacteroidia bacterium]|nr:IS5 family transposase [Bacteroidia bacterium]MCB9232144.1 IS5 family transposase [Bacteroidia bacterium]MCB9233957.1 IS5 family transposase [Bacteroidia bacterium]MCB9234241.1 IS5 family transposase [Bacteroidia bacterium]